MPKVDEEAVFHAARRIAAPDARRRYVEQACGTDRNLQARIEALLRVHDADQSFLETPPEGLRAACAGPPGEDPGAVIGPYRLLEQLGEGGMGTVFLAEQAQPVRRQVALKVIKSGMDSTQVLARFEAERQALALMGHPNIARVLDVGTTPAGRPYFVMELVQGVPITQYCDEHRLTPRQRLELFLPVCQAVQHAHQKGIIHRDLKPCNVLVARYDGAPVPKVIDFGVAKATGAKLTERTLFTEFGLVVGTLEYMSPEQAEPNQLDIDTRSDVYSLGVLLYELLTGTTPLQRKRLKEAGWLELLRMIREEEPPRPSTRLSTTEELAAIATKRGVEPKGLRGLVRGDLDWIVMKCLEKDRARRYETANELALDVGRHLADEPVRAGPPGAGYRLRKFVRRNRGRVVAAGLVLVALLAGTALSTFFAFQATDRAREAEKNANQARDRLYLADLRLAQHDWEQNQIGRLLESLDAHRPERAGGVDRRGFEWYYWHRLCHSDLLTLRDHTDVVTYVAFSPDGKRLASASMDHTINVWDAATGQKTLTLRGHTGIVWCVVFSPDGKQLASAGYDRTIKVWDAVRGQETHSLKGHTDRVSCVAFSPDGRLLASASRDQTIKLWDVASGHETFTLKGHSEYVRYVVFSPDGKRLASAGYDQTIKLWDVASRQETLSLTGHTERISCVAFSPDGRLLASASLDTTVKVWDVARGKETFNLKGHTGSVLSVSFSPDGRLASASRDRTLKVWDAVSGREMFTLKGHTGPIYSVAFSPDGRRLLSGGGRLLSGGGQLPMLGEVKVWDAASGHETLTLRGQTGAVRSVAFSPDGRLLASASRDQAIKLWDVASGHETFTLQGHTSRVRSVAFSPDGKKLASGSHDRTVRTWEVATGRVIHELRGHNNDVLSVAFSPDGRRVVSADGDYYSDRNISAKPGEIKVWDAVSGQLKLALRGHTGGVGCVAFSPDGKQLASASSDRTVKVWDATSGQETLILQGHTNVVNCVAFSPDGKQLASASDDNTVKVWDAVTGQETHTFRGHAGRVWSVAFSPDGRRLASTSEDQTVKVWDAATGQETLTLKGHTYDVFNVAFSPDGRRLASASHDTTVKVWDARPVDDKPGRAATPSDR